MSLENTRLERWRFILRVADFYHQASNENRLADYFQQVEKLYQSLWPDASGKAELTQVSS